MNKYLFELHMPEKTKLYISFINQLYFRLQAYKKYGDAAVNNIDRIKGLEECKRITLEELHYYLEKLKKELSEEDYKQYLNYNCTMISEIQ